MMILHQITMMIVYSFPLLQTFHARLFQSFTVALKECINNTYQSIQAVASRVSELHDEAQNAAGDFVRDIEASKPQEVNQLKLILTELCRDS